MTFIKLSDVEDRELMAGFHGRFVHSANMTFAYWDIDEGALLPEHSHPHEQVVNIIEGELELNIGGETKIMEPGDVAVIPGDVSHTGKAITKCRVIDVFYPVREDYNF